MYTSAHTNYAMSSGRSVALSHVVVIALYITPRFVAAQVRVFYARKSVASSEAQRSAAQRCRHFFDCKTRMEEAACRNLKPWSFGFLRASRTLTRSTPMRVGAGRVRDLAPSHGTVGQAELGIFFPPQPFCRCLLPRTRERPLGRCPPGTALRRTARTCPFLLPVFLIISDHTSRARAGATTEPDDARLMNFPTWA